jgi:hypothetical protein
MFMHLVQPPEVCLQSYNLSLGYPKPLQKETLLAIQKKSLIWIDSLRILVCKGELKRKLVYEERYYRYRKWIWRSYKGTEGFVKQVEN